MPEARCNARRLNKISIVTPIRVRVSLKILASWDLNDWMKKNSMAQKRMLSELFTRGGSGLGRGLGQYINEP